MRIIMKHPGMDPRVCRIENELKDLQRAVGGNIETVTIATDCTIICNEEGKRLSLPPNEVLGMGFRGTVLVVGVHGEEFCDIPDAAINMVMDSYNKHLRLRLMRQQKEIDEERKRGVQLASRLGEVLEELRRTASMMHELEDALDAILKEQ